MVFAVFLSVGSKGTVSVMKGSKDTQSRRTEQCETGEKQREKHARKRSRVRKAEDRDLSTPRHFAVCLLFLASLHVKLSSRLASGVANLLLEYAFLLSRQLQLYVKGETGACLTKRKSGSKQKNAKQTTHAAAGYCLKPCAAKPLLFAYTCCRHSCRAAFAPLTYYGFLSVLFSFSRRSRTLSGGGTQGYSREQSPADSRSEAQILDRNGCVRLQCTCCTNSVL